MRVETFGVVDDDAVDEEVAAVEVEKVEGAGPALLRGLGLLEACEEEGAKEEDVGPEARDGVVAVAGWERGVLEKGESKEEGEAAARAASAAAVSAPLAGDWERRFFVLVGVDASPWSDAGVAAAPSDCLSCSILKERYRIHALGGRGGEEGEAGDEVALPGAWLLVLRDVLALLSSLLGRAGVVGMFASRRWWYEGEDLILQDVMRKHHPLF